MVSDKVLASMPGYCPDDGTKLIVKKIPAIPPGKRVAVMTTAKTCPKCGRAYFGPEDYISGEHFRKMQGKRK